MHEDERQYWLNDYGKRLWLGCVWCFDGGVKVVNEEEKSTPQGTCTKKAATVLDIGASGSLACVERDDIPTNFHRFH